MASCDWSYGKAGVLFQTHTQDFPQPSISFLPDCVARSFYKKDTQALSNCVLVSVRAGKCVMNGHGLSFL